MKETVTAQDSKTTEGSRGLALFAAAIGAIAVGAFAIGALAIRRLTIREIVIEKARFKSLEIQDLSVKRLRAAEVAVSDSIQLPEGNTLPGGNGRIS